MRKLGNFGSAVIEKILMTICSISICFSGIAFLTKTVNNSIKEQNVAYNLINLNDYFTKSSNITVTSNSIKVNTDKKIARVFIDFIGPKGWTHCGYPNRMCEVRSDTNRMYFQFSVDKKTWFTIGYNCEHLQGKKFWWTCDISSDKKEITNIRIGTKEEKIPELIKAVVKKENEINGFIE